jgi:hypothetical protein
MTLAASISTNEAVANQPRASSMLLPLSRRTPWSLRRCQSLRMARHSNTADWGRHVAGNTVSVTMEVLLSGLRIEGRGNDGP